MDTSELFESLRQVPSAYEDFKIERVEQNHFLKDILSGKKCKLPYFLVTKQCALKDQSVSTEIGDESVDGSPLKLQEFDIPQAFVNEQGEAYSAVPVMAARHIISLYTIGLQSNTEQLEEKLPLWILCEDLSLGSTVALGVDIEEDGKNCVISTSIVTAKGPVDEKSVNFPQMISRHAAVNGHSMNKQCTASYSITKPLSGNITGIGEQGSLMVHLSWKNCTNVLEPPPPNAQCRVHAVVGEGDIRSPAHFIYLELKAVERIANGIQNKHVEWEVQDTDRESRSIEQQVKELIENTKLINIRAGDQKNSEDATSPLKNIILEKRHNLDFTEKLWDILKHCGSYAELHRSLSLVLTLLQQGTYQPMLHRANQTRLACLIRDSFSKKLVIPELSDLVPLEILLELGVRKLQSDYIYQLVTKELVTEADLEQFVSTRGGDGDRIGRSRDVSGSGGDVSGRGGEGGGEGGGDAACERLRGLHGVVELVVMLEQYLPALPPDVLRTAARHALHRATRTRTLQPRAETDDSKSKSMNDNSSNNASDSDFTIPVSARCLGNQLQELQPATWTLCLEAGVGAGHYVYHFSPACPLAHVAMSLQDLDDTQDNANDTKQKYIMTVIQEHKMTSCVL